MAERERVLKNKTYSNWQRQESTQLEPNTSQGSRERERERERE
jgi:hypothetical protein